MPLKTCIYSASWSAFGGGEKYALTVAEVLSRTGGFDVELLVEDTALTGERFASYFGRDVSLISVVHTSNVRQHLRTADIGIILSNFRPFGHRAKKNVYLLQMPYRHLSVSGCLATAARGRIREATKDLLRLSLFRDARSANLALANSAFTQQILSRTYDIHAQVLYPPIDDFEQHVKKRRSILSVGRFFRGLYNDKRHDILLRAFKLLLDRHPHLKTQLHIAGSCGHDDASRAYLQELRVAAQGYPVQFHPNASLADLRGLYNEATIYWHAAGYDIDEGVFPERTEHFGMTTVEAMSARCIPVVINKGGQKEIVVHGTCGFLWNHLDEAVDYTAALFSDPQLRSTMAEASRQRFRQFNKEHFVTRLLDYVQHMIGTRDGKRD